MTARPDDTARLGEGRYDDALDDGHDGPLADPPPYEFDPTRLQHAMFWGVVIVVVSTVGYAALLVVKVMM